MPESREHKSVLVTPEDFGARVLPLLACGGTLTLTVTGHSMSPTLKNRRDAVVLAAPQGDLRPGQIVFFRRGNGDFVLHRVIRADGEYLLVNGDAQTWTERVRPGDVAAVAVKLRRNGRWYDCGTVPDRMYCFFWGMTRKIRPQIFKAHHILRSHTSSE